eukprot:evm.model.scf_502.5 EVM.evm.TU.scf_502.5   scf_502:63688-66293(-)
MEDVVWTTGHAWNRGRRLFKRGNRAKLASHFVALALRTAPLAGGRLCCGLRAALSSCSRINVEDLPSDLDSRADSSSRTDATETMEVACSGAHVVPPSRDASSPVAVAGAAMGKDASAIGATAKGSENAKGNESGSASESESELSPQQGHRMEYGSGGDDCSFLGPESNEQARQGGDSVFSVDIDDSGFGGSGAPVDGGRAIGGASGRLDDLRDCPGGCGAGEKDVTMTEARRGAPALPNSRVHGSLSRSASQGWKEAAPRGIVPLPKATEERAAVYSRSDDIPAGGGGDVKTCSVGGAVASSESPGEERGVDASTASLDEDGLDGRSRARRGARADSPHQYGMAAGSACPSQGVGNGIRSGMGAQERCSAVGRSGPDRQCRHRGTASKGTWAQRTGSCEEDTRSRTGSVPSHRKTPEPTEIPAQVAAGVDALSAQDGVSSSSSEMSSTGATAGEGCAEVSKQPAGGSLFAARTVAAEDVAELELESLTADG